MKKRYSSWLLGLNFFLAVLLIGFMIVWDAFDLSERLSLSQIEAFNWGARTALLLTLLIGLTGLILDIRFFRRAGGGKVSFRWARHLFPLVLLASGIIWSHVKAAAPVHYTPPMGAVYAYEEIRLTLPGGDILAGSLTLPKRSGVRVPAMVLITGSSPHDRDNGSPEAPRSAYRPFRQIAHRLSSQGIAVLRMDHRGVGQSRGGNIRQLNTAERAKDIETGIAYLRQRPDIDTTRIGLLGLSEGVSIAHIIASQDKQIKALVFLSGVGSPGREVLQYQIQQGVLTEDQLAVGLKQDQSTRFLYDFDPLLTARQITQPVLILHGTRDQYVPPTGAYRLEKAIKENGNQHVTLRMLEGYDHALLKMNPDGTYPSARIPDEVLDLIQNWVVKEL